MYVFMWLLAVTKIFMFQKLPHQLDYFDCTTDLPLKNTHTAKRAKQVVIGPTELSDLPLGQSTVNRGVPF